MADAYKASPNITGWPNSPTLDWTMIKFQDPVPDWTGITPDARMIAALEFQATGGVPQDEEVTNASQTNGTRASIPAGRPRKTGPQAVRT